VKKFRMIEVNSIDAKAGEVELVVLATNYVAARLFTPRQQKVLDVIIDLTSKPVRVPLTRKMLTPTKTAFGRKMPHLFEMTVSSAAGIRDAAEVIAHELLHISQVVNGRLCLSSQVTQINGRKRRVDIARWMGGKPVMIDALAWHNRPWEVEACQWQQALVREFLLMSTGAVFDQPLQKPAPKKLALYEVAVSMPALGTLPTPDATHKGEPDFSSVDNGSKILESNGASINAIIGNGLDVSRNIDLRDDSDALPIFDEAGPAPDLDILSDDDIEQIFALEARRIQKTADGMADHDIGADGRDSQIAVDVPGMEVPRLLARGAVSAKMSDLRSRGLAS
jgi:hypothetical protein